jgi:hypothetical protein
MSMKRTKEGATKVGGWSFGLLKDLATAYIKSEAKGRLGLDLCNLSVAIPAADQPFRAGARLPGTMFIGNACAPPRRSQVEAARSVRRAISSRLVPCSIPVAAAGGRSPNRTLTEPRP